MPQHSSRAPHLPRSDTNVITMAYKALHLSTPPPPLHPTSFPTTFHLAPCFSPAGFLASHHFYLRTSAGADPLPKSSSHKEHMAHSLDSSGLCSKASFFKVRNQPVYSCKFFHSVLQFSMLLFFLIVNTSDKSTCFPLFPPISININISVIR